MILIRRSKINSLIKLRELKNLRQLHPEMNKSAGWLLEHSDNLINVRKELIVNDSFTSEEYHNTNRYIKLLTDENYEEITKLNFKIEEFDTKLNYTTKKDNDTKDKEKLLKQTYSNLNINNNRKTFNGKITFN